MLVVALVAGETAKARGEEAEAVLWLRKVEGGTTGNRRHGCRGELGQARDLMGFSGPWEGLMQAETGFHG